MKVLKKAMTIIFVVVLSLGIFQLPAFAIPGGTTVVNGFGIIFDLPCEGDLEYPEVEVIPAEGIDMDDVSISFLTKEKEEIDLFDMIEGEEYFAVIQVNADVANGYEFYELDNEPCLTLSVNGNSTVYISGGMPLNLDEGYFVTDGTIDKPYNYITILEKFVAQSRVNYGFNATLDIEDEKIKVGETSTITVPEIDIKKDRIIEYAWQIVKGEDILEMYKTTEDAINFTPSEPGTYRISLKQVILDSNTLLCSTNDNDISITVTGTFTAKVKADKENIKVGETVKVTATDIINQDNAAEYTWQILKGEDILGSPKTAEGTINFTPSEPGTYRVSLKQVILAEGSDQSTLEGHNSYIDITVVASGNTKSPETGNYTNLALMTMIIFTSIVMFLIVFTRARKGNED